MVLLKNKRRILLVLLILTAVLITCIAIDTKNQIKILENNKYNSYSNINQVISYSIEDQNNESNKIEPSSIEEIEETLQYTDEELYRIVVDELEKLENGDEDTIFKYFGSSDIYEPKIIADRIKLTNISFISTEYSEDNKINVNVHICTIDYKLMNSDFNTAIEDDDTNEESREKAKKDIAANLLDGKYDVCYNIQIKLNDNLEIEVSEAFKQAITGNWYVGPGIELNTTECLVE